MNKEKLLIIGGCGYIGSFLAESLNYDIKIVDLNLFNFKTSHNNIICDYNLLDTNFLKKFDHIILLAGHSSVRMCDGNSSGVFNNNVTNFINLLEKICPSQTFIYASSASVYGNSQKNIVNENEELSFPYNMYDFTKQSIDSYITINKKSLRIFGLRFGTVNGYSPHLRNDVMLNSMAYNAIIKNEVVLYNSETRRSILGLNDLKNCIEKILKNNKKVGGIYNLSSFTKTAGEMATTVGKKLNVNITTVVPSEQNLKNMNEKLISSKYNFGLDCSKFSKDFDYVFTDTIDTIVDGLSINWNNMYISNRNSAYNYESKV